MSQNVVSAKNSPEMANDLLAKATAASEPQSVSTPVVITAPSDTLVTLPGGYINAAGEVIKTAEVRELTGRDEEFVGKAMSANKAFSGLLARAVLKIGDEKITDSIIETLLIGDRDALMLGIYKATFGPTAEISSWCPGCVEYKTVEVDVDRDIEVNTLSNPFDRQFYVEGKSHNYLVSLPTGVTQREVMANSEKTAAELHTILLEQTVLEIDGGPVISKGQIQNMSIVDRRKIGDELNKRACGPVFTEVQVDCPDCEGKVVVPINLGSLFRF